MKRLWKKRAVKIAAAAVVVVALALLGLWIWSLEPLPVTSSRFLAGREFFRSIRTESGRPPYKIVTQTCSFEADFNDVCTNADAELLGRGFKVVVRASQRPETRRYVLQKDAFSEWTSVTIYGGRRFTKFPLRQFSRDRDDYCYGYESSDGWVAVEVAGKQFRSGFLDALLDRLKMRWQAARRPPPRPAPLPVPMRQTPQSDYFISR